MSPFVTVFRKEVLESLRDRRTLLSALVLGPIGVPLLFVVLMNVSLSRGLERADEPAEIAVAGRERAPNLVAFLERQGARVHVYRGNDASATRDVRTRREPLVLVIPADYGTRLRAGRPAAVRLYQDTSDTAIAGQGARVAALLQAWGGQLAAQRLQVRGLSPALVQPVVVDRIDVATPAARALLVLGMLSYFVLLATLTGGMYVAIDSTAGERERGSLEPLLATAVPRELVVYGKIAAAAAFMALSLALTLAGFSVAVHFVPLERLGMQANFGPAVAAATFALTVPFVLLGASLMTIVASFTKSYREAQSWLTAVLLVPTVPIVFAAIYQVQPATRLMWIPSLSQHLIIHSLLRAERLEPLHVGLSVAATLAIGIALAFTAARLYRREGILG